MNAAACVPPAAGGAGRFRLQGYNRGIGRSGPAVAAEHLG
jgi:hypothetical protein